MGWGKFSVLIAMGAALVSTGATGCGGNVENGGGSGGNAGGSSGSGASGGSGANGGTNNGGSGNGGSGNEGGGGGSLGGKGGGAGTGSGGSGDVAEQAVQNCFAMCNAAVSTPCPDGWDVDDCRGNCGNVFDREGACLDAVAAAYACVAAQGASTFTCDDDGHLSLKCGPCDAEAAHLAAECDETIACTF